VRVSDDRHMQSGLCELFDGEEFAHSCFFDNEPHSATVKTVSPCQLAVIDAEKLNSFFMIIPKLDFCTIPLDENYFTSSQTK
jgi:Cyclic nucleotide-binding domain.